MAEKKKGMPVLAVVGIGCLIVAIVAAIAIGFFVKKGIDWVKEKGENPAKTFAELAIRNDPNLEVVRSDEQGGTITFLDKRTGKETTVNWEQFKDGKLTITEDGKTTTMELQEGKATVTGPDGTTTFESGGGIEKLPEWFTVPEGIANWKSSAHHEQSGGRLAGLIAGESGKSLAELLAEFETNLAAAGFTRKSKTETANRAILHYEDAVGQRNLRVTITDQRSKRLVTIGYDQQ